MTMKKMFFLVFSVIVPLIMAAQMQLTETNCSNGIDDDGDGLIDCIDPDCLGNPACGTPNNGPVLNGVIEGTGSSFEVTNSDYLNVTLTSSTEITILLSSVSQLISMNISKPVTVPLPYEVTLTITGLLPLTVYFKYDDSYHNLDSITTDANGNYTWIQNLTEAHHIWIQPTRSTIFICDDATGCGCPSVGTWDPLTKTCTLTTDVTETIQIDSPGITLDGNNHSIIGSGTGYGIYISEKNNVTIKNCVISNFTEGIRIEASSNITFTNNNINLCGLGMFLNTSLNDSIANNTISSNGYGIMLYTGSNYNTLNNNNVSNNSNSGIYLSSSSNNSFSGNTFQSNYYGISGYASSYNNLIGNTVSLNTSYGIHFNQSSNNILINNVSNSNSYGIYLQAGVGSNTLANNTTNSNSIGIYLYNNSGNSLSENAATGSSYSGFILSASSNNTIHNNNSSSNNGFGMVISSGSYNTFTENIASNNLYSGLQISGGSNHNLSSNTVSNNNTYGIRLDNITNSSIQNNTVEYNNTGFYLYNISGNNFTGNNISNNSNQGIFLQSCLNNIIGGTSAQQPNTINNNGISGISLNASNGIKISGNNIYNNPIAIINISSNNNKIAPVITSFDEATVTGTSEANDIIEIFGSTGNENANEYLTSVTADANGNWNANVVTTYQYVVGTATGVNNNTSPLSTAIEKQLSPAPGSTCATALEFPPATYTCTGTDIQISGTEYWMKFVADTTSMKIAITAPTQTPVADIRQIYTYLGDCDNLTLLEQKNLDNGDILEMSRDDLVIGNTYYLKVLQQNVVNGWFGVCLTKPLPTTKLIEANCGATNVALNQIIAADSIPNATEYTFWIADTTFDSVFNKFITNTTRYLDLSSVAGVEFNKTYLVWVNTKINNIQARYGSGCSITTVPYPIDTPVYDTGKIFIKVKDTDNTVLLFNSDSSSTFNQNAISNISFINHFGITKIFKPFDVSDVRLSRIYSVEFSHIGKEDSLVLEFQGLNFIEYAEKIPQQKLAATPGDFNQNQGYLLKIRAYLAWEITNGVNDVVVAVVDDAVNINHEDLIDNIWINQNEIPAALKLAIDINPADGIITSSELIAYVGEINGDGVANLLDVIAPGSPILNGIDDETPPNGYIDDIFGWNATTNNNNPNPPLNATNLYFTHGTHSAGLIGATTNNGTTGIAALCSKVKIMPVKTKVDGTSGDNLQATISGVWYAIKAGAKIINMPWYSPANSLAEQDVFTYAHQQGIVLIAAAGNENANTLRYPAAYNFVIGIGSSTMADQKASFSNWGPSIDILAPGEDIYSTLAGNNNSYGNLSGTSTSASLVSGLCALLLSQNPSKTPDEIFNCITNNYDYISPAYIGYPTKRINAYKSLVCVFDCPVADFNSNTKLICLNGTVSFSNQSYNNPTSFLWSFQGGTPSTSTSQNPVVNYSTPGSFEVSLTVTNALGTHTITRSQYITVDNCAPILNNQSQWNFGQRVGLDFTSGIPVEYSCHQNAIRSCASISNNAGQLCFYTNGRQVWDRLHQEITTSTLFINGNPNSLSINGNFNSKQGVLILPSPSNLNHYYIFTVSDIPYNGNSINNGLCYSIIDMSSGLAQLTTTLNVPVQTPVIPTTAYLTAIPFCDNTGYWLVTHGVDGIYSDQLLSYSFTTVGGIDVISSPVNSASYTASATGTGMNAFIETSGDKKWLAISGLSVQLHLYNINSSSGEFYHFRSLGLTCDAISFSPNSNFLYTAMPPYVYQLDLATLSDCNENYDYLRTNLEIPCVGVCSFPRLKLGPDGKIYLSSKAFPFNLSAITNPNNKITSLNPNACGLSMNVISLQNMVRDGFPNMYNTIPNSNIDFEWCISDCNTAHFRAWGCGNILSWDFGDGSACSSNCDQVTEYIYNTIDYPPPYSVSLQTDGGTIQHVVDFGIPPQPDIIGFQSVCVFDVVHYTTSIQNVNYYWSINGTQGYIQGDNTGQGIYVKWNANGTKQVRLTITNAQGCTNNMQVTVIVNNLPTANAGPDQIICGSGSATLTANYNLNYSYLWSTGQNTQSITVNPITTSTYTVTVINNLTGCTRSDDVIVNVDPPLIIAVTSITNSTSSASNDGAVDITVSGGTLPYQFEWSNGATTEDIININPGIYTVTIIDAFGCQKVQQAEVNDSEMRIVYTLENCIGSCDGTAKVTMLLGTPPFTYSWSNGQTTQVAENLCEGTYTVTVTDALSVIRSKNVTINTSFPVIGNEPPSYNITENVTWEGKIYYIQQPLSIAEGAKLTISNCNIFVGIYKKITVNKGASLILDNSVFDGYNHYGTYICLRLWGGIDILGDANFAHPLNPEISSPNHGFMHIKNNSKLYWNSIINVENGIIWLNETSEIHNNHKSTIRINLNNDFPNQSKITDCKFIDKYLSTGLGGNCAISLGKVIGLTIENVIFERLTTLGYSNGIMSSYPVQGNVDIKNCTFINQNQAISIRHNSLIENNQFTNCKQSIIINNSLSNITIADNHFIIPPPSGYPDACGIITYASSGYVIKNNTFESSGISPNPAYASYGIVSDKTNFTGTIFNNTFKSTDVGIQTQDNNAGLNIRCNNFAVDNTTHNIAAWLSLKNYNGIGSLMTQGSDLCNDIFVGDPYAAGNEWSEPCSGTGEMDIKVSATNPINFGYFAHWHDLSQHFTTQPLCSTPVWETNITQCATDKTSTSCSNINPDYSGGGPAKSGNTTSASDLLILISQYKTEKIAKQTLLNNGDKQLLIDKIHNNIDPGLLKNDLIAVSPYLSDKVLLAAINEKHSPLPPGILKEIILANSPVTSAVLNALNLRIPAFPNGIMKEINKAQTGVSQRATVENRISWLTGQVSFLENSLINLYIEQGNLSDAITYMQQSTNPEVQKQLAWLQISEGNFSDARIALQAVLQYSDALNLEENQNYCTLQNLLLDLAEAGTDINNISSAQEQTIRDIAAISTGAAYLAKQILYLVYQEEFEFPIVKILPSSLRLISDLKSVESTNVYATIYPNPNNGIMQLEYSFNDGEDGELVIISITGKEIARYKLNNKNGIFNIPETSLSQGIYFYKVVSSGEIIATDKLVIIR